MKTSAFGSLDMTGQIWGCKL